MYLLTATMHVYVHVFTAKDIMMLYYILLPNVHAFVLYS